MRFGILGPVIAAGTSDSAGPSPTKQRIMLAVFLSRAGKPVAADVLVHALWGDRLPESAAAMVRWHVHQLRRALGDGDRIERTPGGYRLALDDDELDAAQFENLYGRALRQDAADAADLLNQALSLWRGPAYGDLADHDVLRDDAIRLDELRLAALERRIDADLALGKDDLLVPELRKLTVEHPLRERFHAQHLLALYRSERQADALAAFTELRLRLADDLGLDPGPELQRLHQAILANDPALAPSADPPAPTQRHRASPPPPAELPADTAAFTGRAQEIVRLRDQLTADGGPSMISAVTGAGGIGKSALAIHVAHEVAGHFPDGQLYLNLHGSTPDIRPLDPHNALGRLLRSLGITDIPADIEEAAGLFRTLVAGKRLVILLDDAADSAQIRPLLPGGRGSAVLITSRKTLPDLGEAHQHQLDLLRDDEAITLLSRLIGDVRVAEEPDATELMTRLCGHLPLALRIAAARLAARPSATLGQFAERLSAEGRRLGELELDDRAVRASFMASYRELDDVHSHMFRLLGLMDGPDIGIPAAAALADTTQADAEKLLDHLADMQLVEHRALGRYRMHDLIRLFARERAAEQDTEKERASAIRRAARFYLAAAHHASAVLGHREDTALAENIGGQGVDLANRRQAIDWMDTERDNLLSAVRMVSPGGPAHAKTYFALAQAGVARLSSPDQATWLDWFETDFAELRTALTSLQRAGKSDAQQKMAAALWRFCYLRGLYRQGRNLLEAALDHADSASSARTAALLGNAILALYECDYDLSLRLANHCLEQYRASGNQHGMASSLNLLGQIARERADYPRSQALHEQSRNLYEQAGDTWGVGHCLQLSAFAGWLSCSFETARERSRHALQIFRDIGDAERKGWAMLDLGAVAHYLGQENNARALLEEAMDLFKQVRFDEGIAWVLNFQGVIDRSRNHLTESLGIHRDLGDRWRAASVLEAMAAMETDHERGTVLIGAAAAIRDMIGTPVPQCERVDLARTCSRLRQSLSSDGFTALHKRGRALTLEQACAIASH